MGKMKDAFTPWECAAAYEDEFAYRQRDLIAERPVEQQVIEHQEHIGYLSVRDISSMMRSEYFKVKLGDGMSLELAIQCVQSGSAVVLETRYGKQLLVDFENDWFETREC